MRWGATGDVEHVVTLHVDDDRDGPVDWDSIDGAVALIKSKVLADIDPLVNRLFMCFEETEFCLRAKHAQAGLSVWFWERGRASETRRPWAFNCLMARNGLEFARLVAGRRRVVAAFQQRDAKQALVKMRFSPRSDRARARSAAVRLTGLWLGVCAFFRGRWGQPRPTLFRALAT